MRTNHINIIYRGNLVYCFHLDKPVALTQEFMDGECRECPYFYGDFMGSGVECYFDDGSNRREVVHHDPADSEKWGKYTQVRLGLKTRADVDGMLKLHSLLEDPRDLAIPAHLTAPIEPEDPEDLEAHLAEEEAARIYRKNAGALDISNAGNTDGGENIEDQGEVPGVGD